jgi:hypothetical protein
MSTRLSARLLLNLSLLVTAASIHILILADVAFFSKAPVESSSPETPISHLISVDYSQPLSAMIEAGHCSRRGLGGRRSGSGRRC